ncbi:GreA/GreB family elongation factor [Ramlibacter sp. AN1133]|uniref:GreA/GreB family elongation factor n=1 Tax=Ramlibacter sp. AN1133 TaxID=3133429 RepID=UPI0030BD751F
METILPVERTLTPSDHLRMRRLLAQQRDDSACEVLHELLEGSEVLASPAPVPVSLVTLGSRVLLQDTARTGAPYQLTLCEPRDARPAQACISVLSPVGASLLGLCAGQVARWRTPTGQEGAALILAVLFQPEALAREPL